MHEPKRSPLEGPPSPRGNAWRPAESIRPAKTAERAIGRDRNRSIAPLARSSAKPTPVVVTALAGDGEDERAGHGARPGPRSAREIPAQH